MQIHVPNIVEETDPRTHEEINYDIPPEAVTKMMRQTQSSIYSDPIGTIVREIPCNGIDSHDRFLTLRASERAAVPQQGVYTNEAIETALSSLSDSLDSIFQLPKVEVEITEDGFLSGRGTTFITRDFGHGMTHAEVKNIYTQYGKSTKDHDNAEIGGFGVGAKSPFAHVDQFVVRSVKEDPKGWAVRNTRAPLASAYTEDRIQYLLGDLEENLAGTVGPLIETSYLAYKHQAGDRLRVIDGPKDATRTSGVEVHIPIDEKDEDQFKNEVAKQLAYLRDRFEFKGAAPKTIGVDAHYESDVIYVSEKVERNEGPRYQWSGLHAIVGGVPYNIQTRHLDDDINLRYAHPNIALKFSVGEVDLSMSREELQYSDRTKEAIANRFQEAMEDLRDNYIEGALQEEAGIDPEFSSAASDKKVRARQFIRRQRALIKVARASKMSGYKVKREAMPFRIAHMLSQKLNFSAATSELAGKVKEIDLDEKKKKGYRSQTSIDLDKHNTPKPNFLGSVGDASFFLSTTKNDGPVNRYLLDQKHRQGFKIWFVDEDEECFEHLEELMPRYESVRDTHSGFDAETYGEPDMPSKLPVYKYTPMHGNSSLKYIYRKTLENPSSEITYIYGFQSQHSQLTRYSQLAKLLGRDDLEFIRIARKREKYVEDTEVFIGDADALKERLETRAIQMFHTLKLVEKTDWMKVFKRLDETKPIHRIREPFVKATKPMKDVIGSTTASAYRSSDEVPPRQLIQKFYRQCKTAHKDGSRGVDKPKPEYLPEVASKVWRLNHYHDQLYIFSNVSAYRIKNESNRKSALHLLRRTLRNFDGEEDDSSAEDDTEA